MFKSFAQVRAGKRKTLNRAKCMGQQQPNLTGMWKSFRGETHKIWMRHSSVEQPLPAWASLLGLPTTCMTAPLFPAQSSSHLGIALPGDRHKKHQARVLHEIQVVILVDGKKWG